jgi:large subunit ribosomal protein L35
MARSFALTSGHPGEKVSRAEGWPHWMMPICPGSFRLEVIARRAQADGDPSWQRRVGQAGHTAYLHWSGCSAVEESLTEESMPKIKTNRGAAKRFKVTGTGRFVRAKGNKSHILTKKTRKRKRGLRQSVVTDAVSTASLKRMLPYL